MKTSYWVKGLQTCSLHWRPMLPAFTSKVLTLLIRLLLEKGVRVLREIGVCVWHSGFGSVKAACGDFNVSNLAMIQYVIGRVSSPKIHYKSGQHVHMNKFLKPYNSCMWTDQSLSHYCLKVSADRKYQFGHFAKYLHFSSINEFGRSVSRWFNSFLHPLIVCRTSEIKERKKERTEKHSLNWSGSNLFFIWIAACFTAKYWVWEVKSEEKEGQRKWEENRNRVQVEKESTDVCEKKSIGHSQFALAVQGETYLNVTWCLG